MASFLELPDGLHAGVPESVYHARIPGIASKSTLDLVARAPAVYAAWLAGVEREQAPALLFGKALHCAALEPDVYRSTYTVEPSFGDCRKTDNKKRRDEWRAENAGRQLLEQEDATAIAGMVRALGANKLASRLLDGDGVSELTVKWTDPDTGLLCKSRADRYVARLRMCVDLKSTEDARADVFARSFANFGYHRQQAFYEDGFAAVAESLDAFIFVAVEKRPPYLVAVFRLDDEGVTHGRRENRANLSILAECLERGEYPGHPESIQTLSLPAWAKGKNR
jgi:hypothetical protein